MASRSAWRRRRRSVVWSVRTSCSPSSTPPGVWDDRRADAMPRRARVLAMIMAGGKGERLQPLTRERSKSAGPFGGRVPVGAFVLSDFLDSPPPPVFVPVQDKTQSLLETPRVRGRRTGQLP